MRIECVNTAIDVREGDPGIVVFPEYSDLSEIRKAARCYPSAIVIGAIKDGSWSRAQLFHAGCNRIDYLKVESDGSTRGTGVYPSTLPVYELPKVCVGVLVCMDIQCGDLVHGVVQRLKRSASELKLICIPAFMGSGSGWFSNPGTNPPLNSVCVALSNHAVQNRPRIKSFIADATGAKVCEQRDCEPICWQWKR